MNGEYGIPAACQPEGYYGIPVRGSHSREMQRAPVDLYGMEPVCSSEDRTKPGTVASQQSFCAI